MSEPEPDAARVRSLAIGVLAVCTALNLLSRGVSDAFAVFLLPLEQDAVKQIAQECDVVLVVGSPNSSNSNRLKEVAERLGTPAYLIDNEQQIQREWFEGKQNIGLTAGASAPEVLVGKVIQRLEQWGIQLGGESITRKENVVFSLPKALQ